MNLTEEVRLYATACVCMVCTIGLLVGMAVFCDNTFKYSNRIGEVEKNVSILMKNQEIDNKKAEVWFEVSKLIMDKKVPYPHDL